MTVRVLRSVDGRDTTESSHPQSAQVPYLFADSVPFSHNFDFISALEGLVELAAVVLAEGRAARDLEHEVAAASTSLSDQHALLARLLSEVSKTASDVVWSREAPKQRMVETVARLDEVVAELCASQRNTLDASFHARRAEVETKVAAIHQTVLSAVQKFLREYELGLRSQQLKVSLHGDAYVAHVVQQLEGDMRVTYGINTKGTPWASPRRLRDLCGRVRLPVGVGPSWYSREPRVHSRALGSYFIGSIRLEGDVLDLGLRRKRNEQDTLSLQLVRYNDGVTCQIARENDDVAFDVPLEHVDTLVRLWHSLSTACHVEKSTRAMVTDLQIHGLPSLDAQGADRLVDTLTESFRPIVAQLIDHGASTGELSLKRDLGNGLREERFVSLVHLIEKVAALHHEDRDRISGLGLDRLHTHHHRSGSIPITAPRRRTASR